MELGKGTGGIIDRRNSSGWQAVSMAHADCLRSARPSLSPINLRFSWENGATDGRRAWQSHSRRISSGKEGRTGRRMRARQWVWACCELSQPPSCVWALLYRTSIAASSDRSIKEPHLVISVGLEAHSKKSLHSSLARTYHR